MSEANTPSNRQPANSEENSLPTQSESHINPFIHAMNELEGKEENLAAGQIGTPGDGGSIPDDVLLEDVLWEPIPSQASKLSSDRLSATEAASPVSAVSSPTADSSSDGVTLNPEGEDWVASSESTNLSDLISLIQELNQCNTILLDRVSQLEEALERSQNALKTEVQRSQDHPAFTEFNPNGLVAVQELSAAQEQILDLYQQLEFVHQTSQRQQILVETLTGQLEASQERVAHLEREAALVQRRYNEQSQVLTQYENSCRDLQARLHRQQRYTLQFKAALEKSLEVSSPPFESVAAAVAAVSSSENFFLPKAQRIQPWAVPEEESSTHLPWMKLSLGSLDPESPAEAEEETEHQESEIQQEARASSPQPRVKTTPPPQPVKPRSSVVKLPGFGHPIPRATAQPTTIEGSAFMAHQPSAQPNPVELPDEQLRQKLDAAVQPLADMIAQAMLSEPQSPDTGATQSPFAMTDTEISEAIDDAEDSTANLDEFTAESSQISSSRDDEALLNSVMAEAEDALWQDLARLIDVSTEDIVKASLSGDVSAFESINFEAARSEVQSTLQSSIEAEECSPDLPSDQANDTTPPTQSLSPQVSRSVNVLSPKRSNRTQPQSAASNPQPAVAPTPSIGSNSSWPSPVVYPLRPAKKRRSLAAVDLPSFLQQEPGPLPT